MAAYQPLQVCGRYGMIVISTGVDRTRKCIFIKFLQPAQFYSIVFYFLKLLFLTKKKKKYMNYANISILTSKFPNDEKTYTHSQNNH